MKSLLLLVGFALAFTCSPPFVAHSQSDQAQVLPGDRKVKVKDGKTY